MQRPAEIPLDETWQEGKEKVPKSTYNGVRGWVISWVHYLGIIMMNGLLWHLHQSACVYKCNYKPTTHLIHSKYALIHRLHTRNKKVSAYYTLFASCVFISLSYPEWITSAAVENSINKHKDLRATFPFIHTLKVKQVKKKKKEAVADSHTALLLPFSESVMLKVKNSNRRTIQV